MTVSNTAGITPNVYGITVTATSGSVTKKRYVLLRFVKHKLLNS